MDLRDFGALLRQTRENRGMTHEEVASKIKLPVRAINSLEEGQISDLPHPVYARGFMKSYAEILGIERDEILRMLDEAFPLPNDDEGQEPGTMTRLNAESSERTAGRIMFFFVAFLSFSLLLGGGWFVYSRYADSSVAGIKNFRLFSKNNATLQQETAGNGALPATGQPGQTKPDQSGAQENGGGAPLAESTAASGSSGQQGGQAQGGQAPGQAPGQSGGQQENSPANPSNPSAQNTPTAQYVEIMARRSSKVEFSIDGSESRYFSLSKNQTTRLEFHNQLHLKLWNPAYISIKYNDMNFPFEVPAGVSNKVLEFPPRAVTP